MYAILSIGTEITSGQILNTNTQWLAQELLKEGIFTTHHLSVPDDRPIILKALSYLAEMNSVIFITGGLGPTADDFTREMAAQFLEVPLEWNEENWGRVVAKLNNKKVQIREIHKSQCYFPKGAVILKNEAGIADGFYLQGKVKWEELSQQKLTTKHIELFVLPGPPHELQNIFTNIIQKTIANGITEENKWTQRIWTTENVPESEVASQINLALSDNEAQLVAYRVHKPFVDIKLLYQKKDEEFYSLISLKIEKSISDWLKK